MESVEYLGFLIEVVSPKTGTYEYSVFDMTGKDKPEFSLFETDDVEFVSYEAAIYDAKSWIRDFLFLDDDRAVEHIEKLYATKKSLSSSPSAETTGRVLQKLTVDVFNRPDFPDWADYAAVDSNGRAYWFRVKPEKTEAGGWWSAYGDFDKIPSKFDASDWQNSLIERPVLQKLTTAVFNRSDCPDWARYAAVNADGKVVLFSDEPSSRDDRWGVTWYSNSTQATILDDVTFDASDWKNSLIERPVELPDWCKVGVYGYDHDIGYFKIVEIIDCGRNLKVEWVKEKVQGTVLGCFLEYKKQARLRPYNAEEMRGLVGKALKTSDGDLQLITAYYNDSERVLVGGLVDRSADEIKERYIHLDGSPCGKLVHKEGDDWVE